MMTNRDLERFARKSIKQLEAQQARWKARLKELQRERDEAQHRFGELEGDLQSLIHIILRKKAERLPLTGDSGGPPTST